MNPFVLSFADGTTFFVGLGLVLVAQVLVFRFRNRVARKVFTVATIVGVIVVIISATPLPTWAYAIWAIPAISGLVLLNQARPARKLSLVTGCATLVSTVGLCLAETPYHRSPTVQIPKGTIVYVIGDSISAGMGTREHCWPAVLEEMTSFSVVNLAQQGAKVGSAIVQAEGVSKPASMVIIEIGGNDLLGGTDAATFHASLETLVSSLRPEQHAVMLVELPLLPFQNAYGRAQRAVVRKHGLAMLPKRFFAGVLGTKDGTLDGLHLSQAGHNAMAQAIARVLKEE